jgi:hypothetical protein
MPLQKQFSGKHFNSNRFNNNQSGMILAFALVVLVLISLMGVIILANTQSELRLSGITRQGRDTFNVADSTAQVSMLMGRILLHPELGSPETILNAEPTGSSPKYKLTVEVSDSFNLAELKQQADDYNFVKRYLQVGLGGDSASFAPHLVFSVGDKKVANALLSLDLVNFIPGGASLGSGDNYDSSGGPSRVVTLIITVNGRTMSGADSSFEEPGTVITSMFREII